DEASDAGSPLSLNQRGRPGAPPPGRPEHTNPWKGRIGMVVRHSTNGHARKRNTDDLIPAVLYLRMSDDDQEGSIGQQRKEILAWARGRYRIVREYVDSGKSGSKDQEKRVAFRRLVLDSARGDFDAILVWKSNRFGRLDSLEGAEAKKTLRGNGVYLV